jgi:hypothetical protein
MLLRSRVGAWHAGDGGGHGAHLARRLRQSIDRTVVTRPLPATAWLPARTDLFRGSAAQPAHTASAVSGRLSLTVTVEEQPDRTARRFAFHAARQAERRTFSRRSTDHAVADNRAGANAIIDHHDLHNSSRFLAGAIAQARPGVTLHNPHYREAAGAYRRSDLLDADHAGHRSDKKV